MGRVLSSGEEGPSGDAIRSRDSRRVTDSEILRSRCRYVCSMVVRSTHDDIQLADLLVTKKRPLFKLALDGVLNKREFLSRFLAEPG
jgi:hypothetical protein